MCGVAGGEPKALDHWLTTHRAFRLQRGADA
jgi:hypothetical protein